MGSPRQAVQICPPIDAFATYILPVRAKAPASWSSVAD
jgi:hypothetical protein